MMDFYCWDVKPYWKKCPKHTTKGNFVMVLLEKANVYNGIIMDFNIF